MAKCGIFPIAVIQDNRNYHSLPFCMPLQHNGQLFFVAVLGSDEILGDQQEYDPRGV